MLAYRITVVFGMCLAPSSAIVNCSSDLASVDFPWRKKLCVETKNTDWYTDTPSTFPANDILLVPRNPSGTDQEISKVQPTFFQCIFYRF